MINTEIQLTCFHCGQECPDDSLKIEEKFFCCNGCKTVYEILNKHQLCNYYSIDEKPGITPAEIYERKFDYLDDSEVINKLVEFRDDKFFIVNFYIPQMHCYSCIWLLENLFKINPAIVSSKVNFIRRELTIKFNYHEISLKEVVKLLATLGYEPQILLDNSSTNNTTPILKKLYLKIGIAGFCSGNIMLFTFPEYLSIGGEDKVLKDFFSYINLILSLPVFFYSGIDYFISAYKGLKKKIINLDVPLALGIFALFIRSVYEVIFQIGPGYFDSLSGLVFFLLIGKLLQEKTFAAFNFERDYKSYFPLSVTIKQNENEKTIPISKLKIGNRIIIRKNEIIPTDSILINGEGIIDYSFVTGESHPITKISGEIIYAGGIQRGGIIELEVIKELSQSYLTKLWNNDNLKKSAESFFTKFSLTLSKYFTIIVLLITFVSSVYWLTIDVDKAFHVFTSVLIVACPCALALSTPFALGNAMRVLGRINFYLKNSFVIENMAKVNEIVFDKTGTITEVGKANIVFEGKILTEFEQKLVKSLVRNSTHPLSKKIYESINIPVKDLYPLTNFQEKPGAGISAIIYGYEVKLGSPNFVGASDFDEDFLKTKIYLSINGIILGKFIVSNSYRQGIGDVIKNLSKNYHLSLLSGDNEGEKENLMKFFGKNSTLNFKQYPVDKLNYIKASQAEGKKVLMIGDGLNDAGALMQSDVGIAVTDDISSFSPACDAIVKGEQLNKIDKVLKYSKDSLIVVKSSYIISLLYNLIGISVAVLGLLTPIFAAILMPVSSISVILFTTLMTNLFGKFRGLTSKL